MNNRLKVEVHGLDQEGNPVKRGEILWDGKKMSASNDGLSLKNIMTYPVRVGGREIIAKDEPEEFMRALCLQYRGGYLQCDEAVKY